MASDAATALLRCFTDYDLDDYLYVMAENGNQSISELMAFFFRQFPQIESKRYYKFVDGRTRAEHLLTVGDLAEAIDAGQWVRLACPVCGYDLRATPDLCPECGTRASCK